MRALLIAAEIVDEVCVARLHGASNEYLTEDFIPGTAVWGALAARTGIAPGDEPCDEFMTAFYSGRVIFTHLYPQYGTARARPVPLSARTSKSAPGFRPLTTAATGDGPEPLIIFGDTPLYPDGVVDLLRSGSRYEPDFEPLQGWCWEAHSISPAVVMRGHVDRSGKSGTAVEGRLFSRENLVRGQLFGGAIRSLDASGDVALQWLLDRSIPGGEAVVPIGRQPGAVRLRVVADQDPDRQPLPWQPSPDLHPDCVTVTLMSDAVVPDRWLASNRCLSAEWLKGALGDDVVAEALLERHFSAMRTEAGWNGAYGLPRELDGALEAGSAFNYMVEWRAGIQPAVLASRLAAFQARGIGVRRAEGYGEIRLNDPFHFQSFAVPRGGHE